MSKFDELLTPVALDSKLNSFTISLVDNDNHRQDKFSKFE